VISATRICATHTHIHTCKWKFRNFSCKLMRLKAKFPAQLISLFRSFRTQFLVSSGRIHFPATTCLPNAGLGLLCILILFIESIFPPIVVTFSPSLAEKCKITVRTYFGPYFLKRTKKRIIRVCLNRVERMSLLWTKCQSSVENLKLVTRHFGRHLW
jgi:hypothetical protein